MQRRTDVEQLRKEIREAATRLFAAGGYHGTTVQRIADEVGISKQLLLYHFNSKEAVREDVLHGLLEAWNELLPRLLDAMASPGERGPEVLNELLAHLDDTSELGRVAMMELMMGRAGGSDDDLVGAVRPWLRVASDFIRLRQADGIFRADADPEATVVQVGTMLLSTMSLLHLHADTWPEGISRTAWRRRRLAEAIRMVQVSLIAPPAPESGRSKHG